MQEETQNICTREEVIVRQDTRPQQAQWALEKSCGETMTSQIVINLSNFSYINSSSIILINLIYRSLLYIVIVTKVINNVYKHTKIARAIRSIIIISLLQMIILWIDTLKTQLYLVSNINTISKSLLFRISSFFIYIIITRNLKSLLLLKNLFLEIKKRY